MILARMEAFSDVSDKKQLLFLKDGILKEGLVRKGPCCPMIISEN